MRITLLILGAGCTLFSVSLAQASNAFTPAETAGADSQTILGGYVGQNVVAADDWQTKVQAEIDSYEKLQEMRLYRSWKKKHVKF